MSHGEPPPKRRRLAVADELLTRLNQGPSLGLFPGQHTVAVNKPRTGLPKGQEDLHEREDGFLVDKEGNITNESQWDDMFAEFDSVLEQNYHGDPDIKALVLLAGKLGINVEAMMPEENWQRQRRVEEQIRETIKAERKRRILTATERQKAIDQMRAELNAVVDEHTKMTELRHAFVRTVQRWHFLASMTGFPFLPDASADDPANPAPPALDEDTAKTFAPAMQVTRNGKLNACPYWLYASRVCAQYSAARESPYEIALEDEQYWQWNDPDRPWLASLYEGFVFYLESLTEDERLRFSNAYLIMRDYVLASVLSLRPDPVRCKYKTDPVACVGLVGQVRHIGETLITLVRTSQRDSILAEDGREYALVPLAGNVEAPTAPQLPERAIVRLLGDPKRTVRLDAFLDELLPGFIKNKDLDYWRIVVRQYEDANLDASYLLALKWHKDEESDVLRRPIDDTTSKYRVRVSAGSPSTILADFHRQFVDVASDAANTNSVSCEMTRGAQVLELKFTWNKRKLAVTYYADDALLNEMQLLAKEVFEPATGLGSRAKLLFAATLVGHAVWATLMTCGDTKGRFLHTFLQNAQRRKMVPIENERRTGVPMVTQRLEEVAHAQNDTLVRGVYDTLRRLLKDASAEGAILRPAAATFLNEILRSTFRRRFNPLVDSAFLLAQTKARMAKGSLLSTYKPAPDGPLNFSVFQDVTYERIYFNTMRDRGGPIIFNEMMNQARSFEDMAIAVFGSDYNDKPVSFPSNVRTDLLLKIGARLQARLDAHLAAREAGEEKSMATRFGMPVLHILTLMCEFVGLFYPAEWSSLEKRLTDERAVFQKSYNQLKSEVTGDDLTKSIKDQVKMALQQLYTPTKLFHMSAKLTGRHRLPDWAVAGISKAYTSLRTTLAPAIYGKVPCDVLTGYDVEPDPAAPAGTAAKPRAFVDEDTSGEGMADQVREHFMEFVAAVIFKNRLAFQDTYKTLAQFKLSGPRFIEASAPLKKYRFSPSGKPGGWTVQFLPM